MRWVDAPGTGGFPRPRGDGPLIVARSAEDEEVSPPTRGWTMVTMMVCTSSRGFPAHAGMDPRGRITSGRTPRFPRPRGDGPVSKTKGRPPGWVSPPTRGWTYINGDVDRVTDGFPAHAGMDRRCCYRPAPASGFPRPRGDGPRPPDWADIAAAVSPPTRGWTLRLHAIMAGVRGFPAHAGMDLVAGCRPRRPRRFPRPRGDGPRLRDSTSRRHEVSPPTRGWTDDGRPVDWALRGFPAHAGMDPLNLRMSLQGMGFPRPRGDGPRERQGTAGHLWVSPPTRGWTVTAVIATLNVIGFPAHAGMDPRPATRSLSQIRFPRPRGDGPGCSRVGSPPPAVSPPTRGWTSSASIGQFQNWVSPPTRGWTSPTIHHAQLPPGFPAHAGMDRSTRARRRRGSGFPRPRGDGPL